PRHGMVIPTLIAQAVSGRPMTVFGDGTQRRCFTHVSDAVTGLIALAEHPEAVGQIYNVGSTNEISILDLARRIKELSASRSEIELIPYDRAGKRGAEDPPRRVPDLTKINKLTGYVASQGIDAILRDTIADHLACITSPAEASRTASGADRASDVASARLVR